MNAPLALAAALMLGVGTCGCRSRGPVSEAGPHEDARVGSDASAPRVERVEAHTADAGAESAHGLGVLRGVVRLYAGREELCAQRESGNLVCFGELAPDKAAIDAAGGARLVGFGTRLCFLRDDNRTVRCYRNYQDDLADGMGQDAQESRVQREVRLTDPPAQLLPGVSNTCARLENGVVECWGGGFHWPVPEPRDPRVPFRMALPSKALEISGVRAHVCAVLEDRRVSCWGANDVGNAIPGGPRGIPTPRIVKGVADVASLSVGTLHSCALKRDGTVWCWGWPMRLQSDGGALRHFPPYHVEGLAGVLEISSTETGFCARTAEGVYCLGRNGAGEVGDGTTTPREEPTRVRSLDGRDVVQLASGMGFHCALMRDTTVRCWGSNKGHWFGSNSDMHAEPAAVHE